MQEIMVLACPPIAPVKRLGSDKIQGPGNDAPLAPRQDEQHMRPHALADQAEELPRQVRRAPFARTGLHVEIKECVPVAFPQILARHPVKTDPRLKHRLPLLADIFPLGG